MELRSIDTAKDATIDLMTLNKKVVNLRATVKRSKANVISKLTRNIADLKKKKGTDEEKQKNLQKAQRYLDEIKSIRSLKDDKITKYSIANVSSFEQISKITLSSGARAMARLADHHIMKEAVNKFREEHSDWRDLAAYMLIQQTGRKFKSQKKNKDKKSVAENINASKLMTTAYTQGLFRDDTFPKVEEEKSEKTKKNKENTKDLNENNKDEHDFKEKEESSELEVEMSEEGNRKSVVSVEETEMLESQDKVNRAVKKSKQEVGWGKFVKGTKKQENLIPKNISKDTATSIQNVDKSLNTIDSNKQIDNGESNEGEEDEEEEEEEMKEHDVNSDNVSDEEIATDNESDEEIATDNESDEENTTDNVRDEENTTDNVRDEEIATDNESDEENTTDNERDDEEIATDNERDEENATDNESENKETSEEEFSPSFAETVEEPEKPQEPPIKKMLSGKNKECVVKQLDIESENSGNDDEEISSDSDDVEEGESDQEVDSNDEDDNEKNEEEEGKPSKRTLKKKGKTVPDFLTKRDDDSRKLPRDPFFEGSDMEDDGYDYEEEDAVGDEVEDDDTDIQERFKGNKQTTKSLFYKPGAERKSFERKDLSSDRGRGRGRGRDGMNSRGGYQDRARGGFDRRGRGGFGEGRGGFGGGRGGFGEGRGGFGGGRGGFGEGRGGVGGGRGRGSHKFDKPWKQQFDGTKSSKQFNTHTSGRSTVSSTSQADSRVTPKPAEKLHPSWEASRKRKAEQAGIKAFAGTKITFNDDD